MTQEYCKSMSLNQYTGKGLNTLKRFLSVTALGGEIYVWFLWGELHGILIEGSPLFCMYMLKSVRSKVNEATPTSLTINTK